MALRASATARLNHHGVPSPPPSPSSPKTILPFKHAPKLQLRSDSSSLSLSSSTTLSLLALFTAPIEANAFTLSKEDIVTSITQVEEKIDKVQKVSSDVFGFTENAIKTLAGFLKPAMEVAMPALKQAGGEAVKIATPVISEASKKAQEAIQSAGFDTEPVYKTVADAAEQTGKVIQEAKPIASTTVQTISSADPTTIAVTGGVLVLAYFLLPPVFSVISFSFRGYKGDLTPAQVLDLVSSKNYTLIDIRSENDKDKSGVPRLPSSAKNNMIAIPLEDLPSKLKGLVRNPKKLEAELAAVKISYLKKINKGSKIVILDSYTDSAKIVARCLTELGFQNCWIVADGFSGGKGWLQSRLGTDSYNVSFPRVISPSRVIPAVRSFGTTGSTKLLSE